MKIGDMVEEVHSRTASDITLGTGTPTKNLDLELITGSMAVNMRERCSMVK